MNAPVKSLALPAGVIAPSWLKRLSTPLMQSVLPPLVITAALMLIWQLLCSGANAALPPPSQVLSLIHI